MFEKRYFFNQQSICNKYKIDESYDKEENTVKRWQLIEREIAKFSQMTIEDIHNWYYSIKDILIYNQEQLFKYANHNPIGSILSKE